MPPGCQRPPGTAPPSQSEKHCLLLALASGCLGLAKESGSGTGSLRTVPRGWLRAKGYHRVEVTKA